MRLDFCTVNVWAHGSCSRWVQPSWNYAQGKSWLWQHDVSTPPLHLLWLYRKGCLCSNVLKGGEDEVWFRVLVCWIPPEYIIPPSSFSACKTIIQQPPVSSYQWQPDGEHTSNNSRLVDQATLTERAVIVERFCGFRLASCFFFYYIFAKRSLINNYYFIGWIYLPIWTVWRV